MLIYVHCTKGNNDGNNDSNTDTDGNDMLDATLDALSVLRLMLSSQEVSVVAVHDIMQNTTSLTRLLGDVQVREIGIYYTCWWYSLCNFQYRQHYENTCSYNFDC